MENNKHNLAVQDDENPYLLMNRQFSITDREIAERKIRGEHLLIPVSHKGSEMDAMFNLQNEVASWIWEQAKEGLNEEAIGNALAERYEIDSSQAQKDVAEFLDQLLQSELIQLA